MSFGYLSIPGLLDCPLAFIQLTAKTVKPAKAERLILFLAFLQLPLR
jgi:hypothetical protein